MKGYRTLAIDLDPQASLSALFGLQPEFDLQDNDTVWCDPLRRPSTSTIRHHPENLFRGLTSSPNSSYRSSSTIRPKSWRSNRGSERMFFSRIATALASVDNDWTW